MDKHKGMTLTEVLVSVAIGTLLVGVVLSMWYFAYRNWTIEHIRTKLRLNLEIAMERVKEETRLSSGDYTSLYKPSGQTEYKAVSFPMATPDANGFFTLDASDDIYWDKSYIYHLYEVPAGSGTYELRRTVFTNNHDILIDTSQREAQLASCVINGDGASAPNSANASTRVIFGNSADLTIKSKSYQFDGYSSGTKRSDNISFGSIRLTAGDHDFKFEVTGKNAPSTGGYALGIDTLSVTPSGSQREMELYTPYDSSGDGSSIEGPDVSWSGNKFKEYNANAVADFVTFRLYYDAWVESNFNNSIRDNAILTGDDIYVQLADPTQGEEICWQAAVQTESNALDYPSEGGQPALDNFAIRNVLKGTPGNDYIDVDPNQKLVRIKFVAHSGAALSISAAWIAERSSTNPEDGIGTPVQLFFSTLPGVTVPAGGEAWSDWAGFTIADNKDYLVTFYTTAAGFKYWKGISGINSYYASDANNDTTSDSNDAAALNWINFTPSTYIYGIESAENWGNQGTVTSAIYDTKVDDVSNPDYDRISWGYNTPGGTTISVDMRSGDQADMGDATSWMSVNNGGNIPGGLDGNRFVQFRATLASPSPYTSFPWIDNVSINWPGQTKMCDISGYFAQKSNYGIIKLLVDELELTKGFEFSVTASEEFRGEIYETSLTAEVEPRNTGR